MGRGGGVGRDTWRDLAPETSLNSRCRGGLVLAIRLFCFLNTIIFYLICLKSKIFIIR